MKPALGAGIIGGVGGAIAATGPLGMIVVGGVGVVLSSADIYNTFTIIRNETGLTTCTVTRLILDLATMALSGTGIVQGVRTWRASGSLLTWNGSLPVEIAASFRGGNYSGRYLNNDLIVYRAEGQRFGRWYGKIKPDSAAMAEQLFKVAMYGNDLLEVSTYRIPKGTYIFEGWVEGGSGWQYYIPDPFKSGVILLNTEPLPQYGY